MSSVLRQYLQMRWEPKYFVYVCSKRQTWLTQQCLGKSTDGSFFQCYANSASNGPCYRVSIGLSKLQIILGLKSSYNPVKTVRFSSLSSAALFKFTVHLALMALLIQCWIQVSFSQKQLQGEEKSQNSVLSRNMLTVLKLKIQKKCCFV